MRTMLTALVMTLGIATTSPAAAGDTLETLDRNRPSSYEHMYVCETDNECIAWCDAHMPEGTPCDDLGDISSKD